MFLPPCYLSSLFLFALSYFLLFKPLARLRGKENLDVERLVRTKSIVKDNNERHCCNARFVHTSERTARAGWEILAMCRGRLKTINRASSSPVDYTELIAVDEALMWREPRGGFPPRA